MKTKCTSPFAIHPWTTTAIGTAIVVMFVFCLAARAPAQTGFGNALQFDGTGDYVLGTPSAALDLTNGTIEFWVKPGALVGNACILGNRAYPEALTTRYSVHLSTTHIHLCNAASDQAVPCPTTAGTWYHVALVGSQTNTEVFVDGVSRGLTGNAFTPAVAGQRRFTIGATYNDSGAVIEAFTGQLDEVRIWNVARTAAEIRATMHQPPAGNEPGLVAYYPFNEGTGGTAYDATANYLDGTLIGNTAWVASGVLERSLALAADGPQWTWTTSGNNKWGGQTGVTHDGVDAARSGTITHDQSSTVQTTVAGPTTLSFWWKVSSEYSYDYLRLYVDGAERAAISGEVNWQRITTDLAAGNHTVRWTYSKDYSVNLGQDAGWVDQVESSPLALALDAPQWTWTTSGNANWLYQTAVRHDGVDAARSGTITHDQSSTVETTVTGPGVLSFWWKVSSEEWWDYLQVFLDGAERAAISGEVDWQQRTVCVPAGNHTVRWMYSKDLSISSGQDAGFVDQVTLSPGTLAILTEPAGQVAYVGGSARFAVDASGPAPVSYQWRVNGTNLVNNARVSGATSATLGITGVLLSDVGYYSVVVFDGCTTVPSADVALSVGTLGYLYDDFEPGVHLAQWSAFSGTLLATNYGGSVSGIKSLWFGGDGPRFAVSRPLDTTRGGVVDFYLRIANGAAYPWELADLPAKGIVLEYSTDGGTVWGEMGRYNTATYFNWTHVSVTIPIAAQRPSTLFRWRQLSHNGNAYDHWALDDVASIELPQPALLTGCSVPAPGQFRLQGTGTMGLTYTLQTSTNFVDWVNHTNVVAGPAGSIEFLEQVETNAPALFYRLSWP